LLSKNGIVPGTVLVDGFVQGVWQVARRGGGPVRLTVRPFRTLPARWAAQLRREAALAAEFAARGGGAVELVVEEPG